MQAQSKGCRRQWGEGGHLQASKGGLRGNQPAHTLSGTSSLQTVKKLVSVDEASQSVVFCYGIPRGQIQECMTNRKITNDACWP